MSAGRDRGTSQTSAAVLVLAALLSCATRTSAQPPAPAAQKPSPDRGAQQSASPSSATPAAYDDLFEAAREQLASGQAQQAVRTAERAIDTDGARYEAHLAAASALRAQKKYDAAAAHLQTALALAPEEARPDVMRAITEVRVAGLQPEARRQLDAVMLVVADADRAIDDARQRFLREFMARSTAFLEGYPFVADLWLLRARAAMELDYPEVGRAAAYHLRELGLLGSDDPALRDTMAQLERKDWLGKKPVPLRTTPVQNVQQLRSGAAAGDGYLQWVLGDLTRTGYDGFAIKADEQTARRWLLESAAQGFAAAQLELGLLDDPDAFGIVETPWFQKAASSGLPGAQMAVGNQYWNAVSPVRDPAQAVRWFRKAAESEVPAAEFMLGTALRYGEGVAQDAAAARTWYRSAAEQAVGKNSLDMINLIAQMYARDEDPAFRDGPEAVRLGEKACADTSYKVQPLVQTLADAYAEAGMWDQATATAKQAMELLPPDLAADTRAYVTARYDAFLKHEPKRDSVTPSLVLQRAFWAESLY